MGRKLKFIFIVSLAINFIGLSVGLVLFYKAGGVNYVYSKMNNEKPTYLDNVYYKERMSVFEDMEVEKGQVIFIGDSITHQGLWNELIPNSNIINRGIGSDTTEGVKHRLEDVVNSKPSKIFMLIGINDLYEDRTIDGIKKNYVKILSEIQKNTPETKVYLQSVLPVNNEVYGDAISNKDVLSLNKELQSVAKDFNYEYIDIYSKLSKDDQLVKDLTVDGIHLNSSGYKVWRDIIQEHVQ